MNIIVRHILFPNIYIYIRLKQSEQLLKKTRYTLSLMLYLCIAASVQHHRFSTPVVKAAFWTSRRPWKTKHAIWSLSHPSVAALPKQEAQVTIQFLKEMCGIPGEGVAERLLRNANQRLEKSATFYRIKITQNGWEIQVWLLCFFLVFLVFFSFCFFFWGGGV